VINHLKKRSIVIKYIRCYVVAGFIEVVSKPPLGPKSGVGERRPILKILNVFLRLATTLRLDFEPD
jgi:hypothetical protein